MGISRNNPSSKKGFTSDGMEYNYIFSDNIGKYQVRSPDGSYVRDIDRDEFIKKFKAVNPNPLSDEELKLIYPIPAKPAATEVNTQKSYGRTKITTDGVCAVVEGDAEHKILGSYCGKEPAPLMKDGKPVSPVDTKKLKSVGGGLIGGANAADDVKRIQALKDSLPPQKLDEIAQAAQGGANLIIKEVGSQTDHPLQRHFGYAKPVDKINPQLRH